MRHPAWKNRSRLPRFLYLFLWWKVLKTARLHPASLQWRKVLQENSWPEVEKHALGWYLSGLHRQSRGSTKCQLGTEAEDGLKIFKYKWSATVRRKILVLLLIGCSRLNHPGIYACRENNGLTGSQGIKSMQGKESAFADILDLDEMDMACWRTSVPKRSLPWTVHS